MNSAVESLLFPPPNLTKLVAKARPSKKLLEFCDFAEQYLLEEVPGQIPRKFQNPPESQKVVGGLWCEILVGLNFYARWKTVPPEEDIPENFPKGLGALVERSRAEVVEAIALVRNEDWAGYIQNEYLEAFERCEGSCAAQGLGHWPAQGAPRVFTREQVEAGMNGCKNSVVGVVDYAHIYRTLLTLAVDNVG